MDLPENHLKHLSKHNNRLTDFSIDDCGIFFDFSRQRVNGEILSSLIELANEMGVKEKFQSMVAGDRINFSEKRAALHTAVRSSKSVYLDDLNIKPEMDQVKKEIRVFSEDVRNGKIKGTTGKNITNIVVVGIGGSTLGTQYVFNALEGLGNNPINTCFLSSVDIENFRAIQNKIDAEQTIWIIISKSFSTVETLSNENLVKLFLIDNNLDPAKHIVTITSKGSPGNCRNDILKSFPMFDFIGGRFSVTSAVGGVPISIGLGFSVYEEILKGAELMDLHAENKEPEENLPLIAALINIWNNHYLNYNAIGIIPYATPLLKLIFHLQQLMMESNGKSFDVNENKLLNRSGMIVFGDQGTNAQHSFFQLAHQGQAFPIEFIGVVKPYHEEHQKLYKGVTNHQELWANMISQAKTLAEGNDSKDKNRYFEGNRPSSTILIESLSPLNIGKLLSFYEAKTVYEAFLININPFDQFGVELGKENANDIRSEIEKRNNDISIKPEKSDEITEFYLNALFSGKI
ncbi:MAG: glucose-6-phosphate isomerase [Desulfobacterales bacterium]|nr:glucose-6-phosphate isomerase [Desulfobacterales bacterium]MCP4163929.1 glucose-6-phosphate isomerase [Deltaproteobacteria bacterium]